MFCLNPLFIRSQIQRLPNSSKTLQWQKKVSIPYSSGLRFREELAGLPGPLFYSQSQSLIHQVSDSEIQKSGWRRRKCERSQSLIHQVSDSEKSLAIIEDKTTSVSIPYSSGLRFRELMKYAKKSGLKVSIPYSSGLRFREKDLLQRCKCRNVSIPYSSGLRFRVTNSSRKTDWFSSLNPLFIRSQIQSLFQEQL